MNPSDLAVVLREALVELAWSQWAAIGVAGLGARTRTLVDPEALLVASMSVARWDARLFDEILDWMTVNGNQLDAARLRRLAEAAGPAQRRLILAILRSTDSASDAGGLRRVEDALLAREEASGYGTEPLFRGEATTSPDWAQADDDFGAFGFRRPSPELRAMSTAPDGSSPACLRFALRALVGLGARAEVLTYLLTHEWAHGRRIAQHAAYNQSAVADYLVVLSDAGQVDKRSRGRRTDYRLAGLLRTASAPVPLYAAWSLVWPALVSILEALSDDLSDEAQWVSLADALDGQRDALSAEGFELEVPRIDGWAARGTSELASVVEGIARRCRELVA